MSKKGELRLIEFLTLLACIITGVLFILCFSLFSMSVVFMFLNILIMKFEKAKEEFETCFIVGSVALISYWLMRLFESLLEG